MAAKRRTDFALAMTAFLGVALLRVLPGIALAVVVPILDVFNRRGAPTTGQVSRANQT